MTDSFDIRNSAFGICPVPPKGNANFASFPGQLFSSTQIPVCVWFLSKNKNADAKRGFRPATSVR